MENKFFLQGLILFLAMGIFIQVGYTKTHLIKQPKAPDNQQEIEFINDDIETKDHYFLYLTAAYQHSSGKIMQALESYRRLLKYNPSTHAYNGFLHLLFDVEQFNTVIKLYESKEAAFKKAFADNILLQLIVAQSYLSADQDEKAEKMFLSLIEKHPNNEQVAYFTTIALIKNNHMEKATNLIDKSLKNPALKQRAFLFHFLKSKIFIQQNKLPLALAEIEKSLKIFPRFDRGWLFKAVLLEQMGKINEAIGGYKKFLNLVGRDVMVEKQLVQLLFTEQRFGEALEFLKQMRSNTPDYFFDLALIELKAGNTKKALVNIEKTIQLAPTFNKARLLKVEILLNSKKIDELLSFMKDWILTDCNNISVIHTLLLLRNTGIRTTSLIKTLQAVEKTHPHINILAAIADLAVEANNNKLALQYYQKVVDITEDPELKSKTLFHMGYIYFVNKQTAKLEKTLQEALTYKPVYPSAYNLLAYHYAQTDKNLPQALNLIDKALNSAPHCYYYLHTKGYVLLKLGKRNQAIEAFKQALELAPNDTIIQNDLTLAQEGKAHE